jgi:hypothetical protein
MSDKPTQNERIIHFLRMTHNGLCAMNPLRWDPPITRVAARIHNLRAMGYAIESKHKCPVHGGANHAYYVLADDRLSLDYGKETQ